MAPAAHHVALGDSISIDDYSGGPGRGGASLLHRNRDDDFAEWRGRDLLTVDPDTTFSLLATDGATTRTSWRCSCRDWPRSRAGRRSSP
jgi:hypothetical protein